jgi:RimJ/RimL family protein N-acetyltransferase
MTPVVLEGSAVRLVPMTLAHHAALCAIGLDPDLWCGTTIRVQTRDDMRTYLESALAEQDAGTALPFVITLHSGEVAGSTRFHSFDAKHRRVEIGFTWIAAPWQRTSVNTESKYLMLSHAFDTLGCVRVQFRADAENARSRRAIERLGAQLEGILRSFVTSPHRGPRDLAMYSIVAPEWPAVSARLRAMLAPAG